jgi:hypothetical protein
MEKMLKRKLLVGVALAVMLTMGVMQSAAQSDSEWFAYLLNGATQELVRVNANGESASISLGISPNEFIGGGRDIAFSDDGSRVAFAQTDSSPDRSTTLVVRDIAAQTNTLEIDLGGTFGAQVRAFNAEQTQVAVGAVNYYEGDPNADTSRPVWQLRVVDVASGEVVYELNANDPLADDIELVASGTIMPEVRYFANDQIVFAAVPWGIGGAPELPAYVWQLNDDTLSPIEGYGLPGVDTLDTGELIYLDVDESLPTQEPGGPVGAFNVVMLADKTGQARTVYHNPDWVLLDSTFVNNGRQIAVQMLQPFDENHPAPQVTQWILLDRNGEVSGDGVYPSFSQVLPAPDGYAILWAEFADNMGTPPRTTRLDYVANGATTNLWTEVTDQAGTSWELVWSSPVSLADNLQSFPDFMQ